MDYICPIWRSAVRTHVQQLQVLQSECPHTLTGPPWYVSNGQICEDFGVLFFANHIRALREVSRCWEPLGSATWKALVPAKGYQKYVAHCRKMLSTIPALWRFSVQTNEAYKTVRCRNIAAVYSVYLLKQFCFGGSAINFYTVYRSMF
jgi:hypothetical protein